MLAPSLQPACHAGAVRLEPGLYAETLSRGVSNRHVIGSLCGDLCVVCATFPLCSSTAGFEYLRRVAAASLGGQHGTTTCSQAQAIRRVGGQL
jgi:hypothetical protein